MAGQARGSLRAPPESLMRTLAPLLLLAISLPACAPEAPPVSAPQREHAVADMAHSLGTVLRVPVRGRLIEERAAKAESPRHEMSQDELPDTEIEAVLLGADGTPVRTLGRVRSDSGGYIEHAFPVEPGLLAPGSYTLELRVDGAPVGKTDVRLLDGPELVVRSDIDLTYLNTDFSNPLAMVELMGKDATEREPLPAMETVYAALRAGASGHEDHPLVFVSGSPSFFKRALEGRMVIDKVKQDGVFLKRFDAIAVAKLERLQPLEVESALREQVGYKLGHLLRGRLDLPPLADEILMGDDSEADFVVYSIYARITTGELKRESLPGEFTRAGIEPGDHEALITLAEAVQASLGGRPPVRAIYINLTPKPNAVLKPADWNVAGVTHEHRGAWPLILDLFEAGLVSKESALAVKARLIEEAPDTLEAAAKEGVASGLLEQATPELR